MENGNYVSRSRTSTGESISGMSFLLQFVVDFGDVAFFLLVGEPSGLRFEFPPTTACWYLNEFLVYCGGTNVVRTDAIF